MIYVILSFHFKITSSPTTMIDFSYITDFQMAIEASKMGHHSNKYYCRAWL